MEMFNNFSDVEDDYLRAYNRVCIAYKFVDNDQHDLAKDYIDQFGFYDRCMILSISELIKSDGWNATQKWIRERCNNEY